VRLCVCAGGTVPAGDFDVATCVDTSFIARVQVAFAVNSLAVLLGNLSHMLIPEGGVCVVSHHDVSATVTDLTTARFGRGEYAFGGRAFDLQC
jgi:hypothetical protein